MTRKEGTWLELDISTGQSSSNTEKLTTVISVGGRKTSSHPEAVCFRKKRAKVLGIVGQITEKQAQRKLEAILSRINDPGYLPESSITFQALAQEWQDQAFPEMKPSTVLNMTGHLTNHLLPFFGRNKFGKSQRGTSTRSYPDYLSARKQKRTSSAR